MSWAETSLLRLLRVATLCGAAAGLAGCLTPLYGDPTVVSGGRNAQAGLRDLEIPEIPGRNGVVLRNELIYLTQGGGGRAANPTHVLRVTLRVDTVPIALNTAAGRPSAQSVTIIGDYTVTPIGDPQPIHRGSAFASASFDRTAQRLASDRAVIEAQERATKALAENIVTQVAGWYATRPR
ncbi:LPS assembly lipoprotein LptE [Phreatobacter oligotrophus]|jgi:LPS-assembly lipoprotein|uniref:LPS-assembly lipoprotein n=1 Tax=Phreatobacter oligotrophus TaxID=1122261 RepID=A0A2T4ZEY3_9HYPH|nr:LPS assembly lipoprotein LptE [Phreatobacter oligotrophus]PTM60459.1 LPS-assembly lipoprotein [Phreatobacter oligotrophus]